LFAKLENKHVVLRKLEVLEPVMVALRGVAPLLRGITEECSHFPHRLGRPVDDGGVYDVVSFLKASFLDIYTCGAHGFWRGVALVLLLLNVELPRRNVHRRC
jgi:hypothetical protein